MTKSKSLFVGTREVAEALGVSSNSVLVAIDNGQIPGVTIGRQRRIPKSYLHGLKALAE